MPTFKLFTYKYTKHQVLFLNDFVDNLSRSTAYLAYVVLYAMLYKFVA